MINASYVRLVTTRIIHRVMDYIRLLITHSWGNVLRIGFFIVSKSYAFIVLLKFLLLLCCGLVRSKASAEAYIMHHASRRKRIVLKKTLQCNE